MLTSQNMFYNIFQSTISFTIIISRLPSVDTVTFIFTPSLSRGWAYYDIIPLCMTSWISWILELEAFRSSHFSESLKLHYKSFKTLARHQHLTGMLLFHHKKVHDTTLDLSQLIFSKTDTYMTSLPLESNFALEMLISFLFEEVNSSTHPFLCGLFSCFSCSRKTCRCFEAARLTLSFRV